VQFDNKLVPVLKSAVFTYVNNNYFIILHIWGANDEVRLVHCAAKMCNSKWTVDSHNNDMIDTDIVSDCCSLSEQVT